MCDSRKIYFKDIVAQTYCSFPSTIISYILQRDNEIFYNKPNKFVYKICSICKWFFSKLRLIPCHQLSIERDYLKLSYTPTGIPQPKAAISFYDLKEVKNFFSPIILYTKEDLFLNLSETEKVSSSKIISMIIPKIRPYKILHIGLRNQELTLQELIFLSPNNKEIVFSNCKIIHHNGLIVPVEEILAVSPKLYQLALYCDEGIEMNYCTPLTSQKLAALPQFKNLKIFKLFNVTDDFKASYFMEFIKKNYKNHSLVVFDIKFGENVCPFFVQNFKNDIDSGIKSLLEKNTEQEIYFHAW